MICAVSLGPALELLVEGGEELSLEIKGFSAWRMSFIVTRGLTV
jgi:hypothetical protein